MRSIDFSLGYMDGMFRPELLFTRTHKIRPNVLTYIFGDDAPNMDIIDYDALHAAFPDAVINYNLFHTNFTSSCVEEMDNEFGFGSAEAYIYTDDIYSTIDSRQVKVIFGTSQAEAEGFLKKLLDILPIEAPKVEPTKIKLVCLDDEYYTIDADIKKVDLDIKTHFNDDFLPYYDKIVKFLDRDNKESGLILLNSLPGCGKTTILRHLIKSVPNHYIFITPAMAGHLTDAAFTSFLMSHKNSVFILEDCEQVIMDREDSTLEGAVASLLNMSDGLMSDIFNGKFICTFNADVSTIDEALLRKGRCKVNYTFDKLCAEKTKALLMERGVSEEEAEKAGSMTIADIYNYGVDTGVKDKSLKLGF